MKIISLNIWHGETGSVLVDYVRSQLDSTDVFCFQEASGSNTKELFNILIQDNNFQLVEASKYFRPGLRYAMKTFVKRGHVINSHSELLDNASIETGKALAVDILVNNRPVSIVSVHGVPHPGHKLDTPGRLEQSEQIIDYLKGKDNPAIICGDFNLLPNTRSVDTFTESGYINLIDKYGIKTTRNQLAWDQHPDNIQLFADFAFVSPELKIKSFAVPNNLASDHLPLEITIEPN